MESLANKVALITGATGGLGALVTNAFLAAGAAVAGVSRSIRQSDFPHDRFLACPAELTTSDAARVVVNGVVAKLARIDILVHVMGGFSGGKPVADTDEATLERMLDLNFRSAFYLAAAVIPCMRRQGAGRLIAVGSRAALEPQPGTGAYGASKAALVSLVRTLALENKSAGITCNVVLPGTMDTPANRTADPAADFSNWVRPAHVANLILWLASDAAADVTGAAIPVYGREA